MSTSGVAAGPNVILVNRRQQGNPLLKHVRNVRWQHADVTADYVLGGGTCALFISLRYHLLHPEYILHRIKEQLRAWSLIVILCHVDVDDVIKPLAEVTKAAVINSCTLVCAWSPEECARYLETFKSYESKPAASIQERVEHDYLSRLTSALTGAVRGINRTDVATLGAARGTLADLLRSSPTQLSACPGIGPTKVQRLLDAFQQPFRKEVGAQTKAPSAGSRSTTFLRVEGGPLRREGEVVIESSADASHKGRLQQEESGDDHDVLLMQATQLLAQVVDDDASSGSGSDEKFCDDSTEV